MSSCTNYSFKNAMGMPHAQYERYYHKLNKLAKCGGNVFAKMLDFYVSQVSHLVEHGWSQ